MPETKGDPVTREEFEKLRGRTAALQGAIHILFRGGPHAYPDIALEALSSEAQRLVVVSPNPFNVGYVECLDSLCDYLASIDSR